MEWNYLRGRYGRIVALLFDSIPSTVAGPGGRPRRPLRIAVNSLGSARIAGSFNFNMLFSHLRTPEQYRQYSAAYRVAGGTRLIAANRPVFVGPDDPIAFDRAEPALRTLWRRFQAEGKIPAATPEPTRPEDLCVHPINFIIGGPRSVARQLSELYEQAPFDVANVEVRWAGLSPELVRDSLRRLMEEVLPLLERDQPAPGDAEVRGLMSYR
jgi:alkanesulfonate monooxygenase SsuD/methylene tetrahydromethanopterin reductase-like flavin-dependent oxidoreductase (luciferase family)